MANKYLKIRRPDDFHVHLREGNILKTVLPFTSRVMGKALIMPNLKEPILNLSLAKKYREEVFSSLPPNASFLPIFSLYLTEQTTSETIKEAARSEFIRACKLYPAGATTNSSFGVSNLEKLDEALSAMEAYGLILCVHGESTDPEVGVFDREASFVERILPGLLQKYPRLKVILEHISTKDAAQFVKTFPSSRLAATVTCHHMLCNYNALLGQGLNPHLYCCPVLKSEEHRKFIVETVMQDNEGKFFLGTDSAPHLQGAKECRKAAAGVFSSPVALLCYAKVFEENNALDKLEKFASENGSRFYDLPLNEEWIALEKETYEVPTHIRCIDDSSQFVPFLAGETLHWKIHNQ
ncbi:dihydroorotase [Galdieria sulphuraria]|uniref:dihydroorotase n=2 Tax=Galdieria sulphuraria TaxID=130081 RepID=M2W6R2_GALSU|nr:dihydroorotase [Galdieria sulphuraria]EME31476.1 dihydroorotase [Galdieria sulphuraria]|eukprot:XP_005707996.1 dihydroorotase [Galdieria sulphuraria]